MCIFVGFRFQGDKEGRIVILPGSQVSRLFIGFCHTSRRSKQGLPQLTYRLCTALSPRRNFGIRRSATYQRLVRSTIRGVSLTQAQVKGYADIHTASGGVF